MKWVSMNSHNTYIPLFDATIQMAKPGVHITNHFARTVKCL